MSRTIAIFRPTSGFSACGGLLSLLKGQNGIFFFDVTDARHPRFLMSTKALDSSITDDFFPLPEGGFLITQMGSATGEAPGRVAEFDGRLHFVGNHFGRFPCSGTAFRTSPRRFQSAWHCGASGFESHADCGFRPAEQHARRAPPGPCFAIRCASGITTLARSPTPSAY